MRFLKKLKEEKLLFFDIETARVVDELEIDSPLYNSWEYKVNKDGKMTSDEIKQSYKETSGLFPEFSKVVCIVVGKIIKGKIYLISFKDSSEVDLLNNFNKLLSKENNSSCKLVGFVNTGFDTPYVFKRMIINGIVPDDRLDSSGLKPWEVDEVDLAKVWQGTSFSRASLIHVTTAFGLPSPKDDITGADVGNEYWKGGLDRITSYCEKDVVSTINIFKKMRMEEPLELAVTPDAIDQKSEAPLLERLFDGEFYYKKYDDMIVKRLKEMTKDQQDKAFTIMNSIVSTAKGKKTKITKTAVKRLKTLLKDD